MKQRLLILSATFMLFFGVAYCGRKDVGETVGHSVIRFAWRTSGERVRICTQLSDAELKKIPFHMRRDAGCVSRILPYRLQIELNGKKAVDRAVAPAGIHGDRPLFVQEEFVLQPGTVAMRATFEPDQRALDADGHTQASWSDAASKAPRFAIERTVNVAPGRVVLVALSPNGKELTVAGER